MSTYNSQRPGPGFWKNPGLKFKKKQRLLRGHVPLLHGFLINRFLPILRPIPNRKYGRWKSTCSNEKLTFEQKCWLLLSEKSTFGLKGNLFSIHSSYQIRPLGFFYLSTTGDGKLSMFLTVYILAIISDRYYLSSLSRRSCCHGQAKICQQMFFFIEKDAYEISVGQKETDSWHELFLYKLS